eukprot:NODE_2326_length_1230_cov_24.900085_g2121_i0.p1 GENE.NODE_2326_length_1230_cov_24.900085_g2121_i0~~NODE_2326_length_1230_cov_24.900085_g2121_i0.p1  ORF type:complete len:233 (-),score=64.49 NODE_2326_length_1230_cov_24.900085_g2121_i0:44-742(-)
MAQLQGQLSGVSQRLERMTAELEAERTRTLQLSLELEAKQAELLRITEGNIIGQQQTESDLRAKSQTLELAERRNASLSREIVDLSARMRQIETHNGLLQRQLASVQGDLEAQQRLRVAADSTSKKLREELFQAKQLLQTVEKKLVSVQEFERSMPTSSPFNKSHLRKLFLQLKTSSSSSSSTSSDGRLSPARSSGAGSEVFAGSPSPLFAAFESSDETVVDDGMRNPIEQL